MAFKKNLYQFDPKEEEKRIDTQVTKQKTRVIKITSKRNERNFREILSKKVNRLIQNLNYQRKWAGYAIVQTPYQFNNTDHPFNLFAQREGEIESEINSI